MDPERKCPDCQKALVCEDCYQDANKCEGCPEDFCQRCEKEINVDELVLQRVIIIQGLPAMSMAEKKVPRLEKAIKKHFSGFGEILKLQVQREDLEGGKVKTAGVAFLQYPTAEAATAALAKDEAKFDKKHKMNVTVMSEYYKIMNASAEYKEPAQKEDKRVANPKSWMMDKLARDQFLVWQERDEENYYEVFWNSPYRHKNKEGRVMAYDGENLKAAYQDVMWSPKGTYLMSFVRPNGVKIYSGPNFELFRKLAHREVNVAAFSPNEKFLVTGTQRKQTKPTDPDCIIVWDIRRGEKLRAFNSGPKFEWSFDDRYLARVHPDGGKISVYDTEAEGCAMVGSRSIKMAGVRQVLWSPTQNILSFWVPEPADHTPAVVGLISIPEKKIIREVHKFRVRSIKMYWQKKGRYLAVKWECAKSKRLTTTTIELFRMFDKDIPIEELKTEESVFDFAWEPHGSRFGLVCGNERAPNVLFYQLGKKKLIQLGEELKGRPVSHLHWSPAGDTCILSGIKRYDDPPDFPDHNGVLEFVFFGRKKDDVKCFNPTSDHFKCTSLEWDPTGRFVMTASTNLHPSYDEGSGFDKGYKIWSFQGDLLHSLSLSKCRQVMWRPHRNILTKAQKDEAMATIKQKYYPQFENEDNDTKKQQMSEADKDRQRIKDEWKAYRALKNKEYFAQKEARYELRRDLYENAESDDDDDDVYEIIRTETEKQIDRREEDLE